MSYWRIPAFGELGPTPVVATPAERDLVIAQNAKATAAYQSALAKWKVKQGAFIADQQAYQQALSQIESNYQAALVRYNQALAAQRAESAGRAAGYASAMATYGAQKRARDTLIAQNQANAARVLGPNPPPPGFVAAGYCVTQAQHDQWVWACAPVRGLGSADPVCVWQNLAVCSVPPAPVMPQAPAPIPAPAAPVRAAAPRAPVGPGPEPPPPKLLAVPTVAPPPPPPTANPPPIPEPPPPRPEPPLFPSEAPQQSFAVWGILAAVVVVSGGGYYWYTHRKKAA